MTLHSVPGAGGNEVAPWDRPNLRSLLEKEEKKPERIDVRVSVQRMRQVSKLVQQRIIPEIETQSDAVNIGLGLVLYYAKIHGRDSEDFRNSVKLHLWKTQVEDAMHYEASVTELLDQIESGLDEAAKQGRKKKFAMLYASLEQNKDLIEDDQLAARANKLWVLHRATAKTFGLK